MKLIVLSLFLSSLALGTLVTVGARCPEQQVPNAQGICFRPFYIEGCGTYKNINECEKCIDGTPYSIQVMKRTQPTQASAPSLWKAQECPKR